MNVIEHLLTCLAEEAAEVAQDCCKSLRFGLDDRNVENPNGPTNRERLVIEVNQLFATVRMLQDHGALPEPITNADVQVTKIKRVHYFMTYAETVGALNRNPPKGIARARLAKASARPARNLKFEIRNAHPRQLSNRTARPARTSSPQSAPPSTRRMGR